MTSTTEYPKRMIHPAGVRGTTTAIPGSEVYGPNGNVRYVDYQGTPDRFPPVDVVDANEEEQYRAKGYRPYGEEAVQVLAYLEYPKMLVHDEREPATPAFAPVLNGAGQVVTPAVPGSPAKFPDLTVHNETEEFAAVAKGYRLPGTPDPDAVQAAISSPHDPHRVKSEYPKLVNGKLVHDPDVNRSGVQEYPKWVGDKLVNSRAEEIAIIGEQPEDKAAASQAKRAAALKAKEDAEALLAEAEEELAAPVPAPAAQSQQTPPNNAPPVAEVESPQALTPDQADRPALYAELKRRGIEFSNRWNTDKLRQALAPKAAE